MKKLYLILLTFVSFAMQVNADITLTAVRGSNWGAGEGPAKLVDGTNTKWGSHDDYPFIIVKANSPVKPTSYELTIANDTYKSQGRNWKKWKIYGGNFSSDSHAVYDYSSTGATDPTSKGWVLIDDKNETLPVGTESNPYEVVSLDFSNSNDYYSYFLIVITELSGSWGDYMQMAEFKFTNYSQLAITPIDGHNTGNSDYHYAFDQNLETKWEASTAWQTSLRKVPRENECFVICEAKEQIYVNGITLTTGGDTQSYPDRNPYEWVLYGSNDDAVVPAAEESDDVRNARISHSSWKVIAHINNAQMPSANKTAKKYKFNPSQKSYKYLKFHVKSMVGKDELQLAEIAFDYSTTPKTAYIADKIYSGGNYNNEPANNLFDGSANTKWCKGNNSATNWVTFSTVKPIVASSYSMQTSNDSEQRDPRKFKLYGALGDAAPTTDGSITGWTLIDSEEDATASSLTTDHFAYGHFEMDSPGIYQHFMLKVENTRSLNDPNFQLSELVLNEYDEYSEAYTAISNDSEMAAFATAVNNGTSIGFAYLTADVNCSTPIGTDSRRFSGVFDGMGHKVNLSISGSSDRVAFIGAATGGATIKNLILTGSVTNTGGQTAAFIGETKGGGDVIISHCGNEATINGKTYVSAFVANNWGYQCNLYVTDVYNTGDISGTSEVAAICACQGNGSSVFTNVYNAGTITGDNGGKFVRLSQGTYINCYSTTLSANDNDKIIEATTEMVRSGELCGRLGNSFRQNLNDNDGYPCFDTNKKEVVSGMWFHDSVKDVFFNEENGNYLVYLLKLNEENTKYSIPSESAITPQNINLTRTITADKWIGLCLPFDYDIPSGWDVRELTGVSGSGENASMKFSRATSIVAGKPYIVKTDADVATITATNKTIATSTTDISFNGVTMKGNLKKTSIPEGSFYISNEGSLKKLTAASATLKGFRAYFTVDGGSGVKALSFDFDDDATGINEELRMKNEESTSIFNLAGQRLSKTQKGINIVNGKKVMVK